MIRKLISLCIIIGILGAQSSNLFVYLDFKLNQSYIAEVLCINKDEPIVMCAGSCYLSKQLEEEQEKNEENQTTNAPKNIEITVYGDHYTIVQSPQIPNNAKDLALPKKLLLDNKGSENMIFRPPQLS